MAEPSSPLHSVYFADWRKDAPLLLRLALCKALACLLVLRAGFTAISDDDFARVVIAQIFSAHPSLDPSGTSWLPFPFWLSGGAMSLFGATLEAARDLAFLTSLISTWIIYFAARWIGLERNTAFLGSLVASLLPHSLWLGLATVPEGYTAALSLLAAASLVGKHSNRRWLGALALFVGTLSRYEAWPLAAIFALLTLRDAMKGDLPRSAIGAALLAGIGPAGWMLSGSLEHGDPIFFLHRVAAYRRALEPSQTLGSFSANLLHYPEVLLRAEPELIASILLGVSFLLGQRLWLKGTYLRPLLLAAAQLVFLILGDLADGTPTHHPERPLLFSWLLASLIVADITATLFASSARWRYLGTAIAALGPILVFRSQITAREPFVDRSAEIDIGKDARALIPENEIVALDSEDFGHYAIAAALGRPEQSVVLRSHDPRNPGSTVLTDTASLRVELERLHARWLIIDDVHRELTLPLGSIERERSGFLLLALR